MRISQKCSSIRDRHISSDRRHWNTVFFNWHRRQCSQCDIIFLRKRKISNNRQRIHRNISIPDKKNLDNNKRVMSSSCRAKNKIKEKNTRSTVKQNYITQITMVPLRVFIKYYAECTLYTHVFIVQTKYCNAFFFFFYCFVRYRSNFQRIFRSRKI